ncbi:MAG: CRISPR-associated endonuclease Cas2 [Xanthomonadaceae bacterium]|nr:CRISPR-associated endonuclease Cas2 [Xanthomonadaceae bacterium]MDP2185422.1 CRISPR-associated endonuclease Cas2 [Xanthomonadales bacterium]MDZ4116812.1 CRISPR-associated endonuclease Cas2 [Xanthomonadaceae bacterium]MDZ4379197.1 CRISPR-associated endonuclease Cas2 [Xanthomonadaceae bacterium]
MNRIVIAYDISNPRRLARVHRATQRLATAIEYSVFLAQWPAHWDIRAAMAPIIAQIDPVHDDLRAYPLPRRGLIARLGRATLPPGIHFSALPAPLHEDEMDWFAHVFTDPPDSP